MLKNKWPMLLAGMLFTLIAKTAVAQDPVYHVKKSSSTIPIDGKWNKHHWKNVKEVVLTNYMGEIPKFKPVTHAKMQYDEENLYLIFRVQDQYVSSLVQDYNGPVSGDACVEFFFSPDTLHPLHYFNLEINAGGTPLMRYNGEERKPFTIEDITEIEIAHSLPKVIDPPIDDPVTWTIECRVPLNVLERYGTVAAPKDGVAWRANFYKTASKSSNPHYITWSPVQNEVPNFHLPAYFGHILFE